MVFTLLDEELKFTSIILNKESYAFMKTCDWAGDDEFCYTEKEMSIEFMPYIAKDV